MTNYSKVLSELAVSKPKLPRSFSPADFMAEGLVKMARLDSMNYQFGFAVEKLSDYLYHLDYSNLDYARGEKFFARRYAAMGACSSVRNGDFFGRNYDWTYDKTAIFAIHRKPTQGKYESYGVCSSLVQDSLANSGEYNRIYDYIPFSLQDGINSKHVVCNINVLPNDDWKGRTTGTNFGKPVVPMTCLVRRVLDECDSVEEAIFKIENDWNIVAPANPNKLNAEMHFMIADEDETVIVEFIDNAPVFIREFVGSKPIMTNFYIDGFNIVNGVKTGLTDHAMGVERYDLLSSGYSSANTKAGMLELMSSVNYTKSYDRTMDPFWYSEFYGKFQKYGDLNIHSAPSDFDGILSDYADHWNERTRDGKYWQTVHTTVYDIPNGKMIIRPEETGNTFEFTI